VWINPQDYHFGIYKLTIPTRRTKPLRGRKKGWCKAPFCLPFFAVSFVPLVQLGVILLALLSFGNVSGKFPD